MESMIDKMRADWVVVEADRRACGDWSDEDVKDIANAVRQAVASKEPETIALWARWLADLSAIAIGLKVSGTNHRIRQNIANNEPLKGQTNG